jgi:predicted dehydrogenase
MSKDFEMKLGIIGCGLIGRKRAAACPELQLTAAADVVLERAETLCRQFGGTASSNWRDVLTSDADIVVVATTHDRLAEIALHAVEAGKHVLVEKPGGRNERELAPAAELADKKGVYVKVGFNHRFHPAIRKARTLVDEGAIGPLMFIRGRYGHGGRLGYESEWRFKPEISGGGELLDQGSHLIDLAGWFLGDFSETRGELSRFFWEGTVEDNCFILLKTKENQCAQLQASWTEWKNMFSFEIYGRCGKIAIDGLGGSYGTEQLAFYKMSPKMGPPETCIWQYPFPDNSWETEMREFTAAIKGKRRPVGDVREALKTLSVIDILYEKNCER